MQRGCCAATNRIPAGSYPSSFFGANNTDPVGIPTNEEARSLHNPYQRPIAIHLASSCCPRSRSYKHPPGLSTCRSLLDHYWILLASPITSLRRPDSPMRILAASLRHPCCADGTPCHLWSLDTPAQCNSDNAHVFTVTGCARNTPDHHVTSTTSRARATIRPPQLMRRRRCRPLAGGT